MSVCRRLKHQLRSDSALTVIMFCVCLHRGGLPALPGCFAGAGQQHATVAGQQLHQRYYYI